MPLITLFTGREEELVKVKEKEINEFLIIW